MKLSATAGMALVSVTMAMTSEMARAVAESHGAKRYDTFTGFKFIAEKKNALEGAGEGTVVFSRGAR